MNDCLFCKIIKKEIPAQIVYENEKALAFLDIHPVTLGHTLIVPKEHHENLIDCPENLAPHLLEAIKKVFHAIKKTLGAESFNLNVNSGKEAGQVIFHLHLHLVPRYPDDGLRLWPGKEVSEEELKNLAEKIRKALA